MLVKFLLGLGIIILSLILFVMIKSQIKPYIEKPIESKLLNELPNYPNGKLKSLDGSGGGFMDDSPYHIERILYTDDSYEGIRRLFPKHSAYL